MKSEILLNQQQISDRIAQLGEQITNWAKTFLNSFAHGVHATKIK